MCLFSLANHDIAVFITPVINLVFGIETAFRGFRSNFAPRGKWTVGICNGLVGLVCVLILVVAAVDQGPDLCFAALFWFVNHYATGCFASLAAMAAATLVTIGLIFLKLRKSQMVSPTERLAAQRMVYYLALGFIYEVSVLVSTTGGMVTDRTRFSSCLSSTA